MKLNIDSSFLAAWTKSSFASKRPFRLNHWFSTWGREAIFVGMRTARQTSRKMLYRENRSFRCHFIFTYTPEIWFRIRSTIWFYGNMTFSEITPFFGRTYRRCIHWGYRRPCNLVGVGSEPPSDKYWKPLLQTKGLCLEELSRLLTCT